MNVFAKKMNMRSRGTHQEEMLFLDNHNREPQQPTTSLLRHRKE